MTPKSKVGKLSKMLLNYDAQIEHHKQEIVRLQREKVLASIEARRVMTEESERRSKARHGVAA
jgi:hypothetical protein